MLVVVGTAKLNSIMRHYRIRNANIPHNILRNSYYKLDNYFQEEFFVTSHILPALLFLASVALGNPITRSYQLPELLFSFCVTGRSNKRGIIPGIPVVYYKFSHKIGPLAAFLPLLRGAVY